MFVNTWLFLCCLHCESKNVFFFDKSEIVKTALPKATLLADWLGGMEEKQAWIDYFQNMSLSAVEMFGIT